MWRIVFARVDDRLIHGQIITKWVKGVPADFIIIIDDVLAADKFMQSVYKMAAPPGIGIRVMDVKTASEEWQKSGVEENVFIVFKDIVTVKKAMEGRVPIKELNVGGIGNSGKKPGSNSKQVIGCVTLEESDVEILLDLKKTWNVKTYFQMIPEFQRVEFSSVLTKYFPKLQSNLKEEER